jgi:hypothetical protein
MLLRNNTKNNYNFMVSWSPSCFFNRIRNVHLVQIVVLDIISESVLKSNNFDIKVLSFVHKLKEIWILSHCFQGRNATVALPFAI